LPSLVDWMSPYYIQQCSEINQHPKWRSTDIGILGTGSGNGRFVLPITNRPHLPTTLNRNDKPLMTGRAEDRIEEISETNVMAPQFTLEMPLNVYNFSLFAWLFFQTGASETTSDSVKIASFIPYTSTDTEIYASIVRRMVDASTSINQDTDSHLLMGCVCRSLSISASEGEIVLLKADMIGGRHRLYNTLGKLENSYNFPRLNWNVISATDTLSVYHNGIAYTSVTETSSDGFTDPEDLNSNECEVAVASFINTNTDENIVIGDFNFPDEHAGETMTISIAGENSQWDSLVMDTEGFLKMENAKIYIGDDISNLVATKLKNFSFTFNNNIVPKFYDSGDVRSYSLGKLEGYGEFFIPFSENEGGNNPLSDFKDGNDIVIRIYWGSVDATSDGDMSITTNIRYTNVVYNDENEIGAATRFKLAYDGTTGLNIKCGYDTNKLIRGIT